MKQMSTNKCHAGPVERFGRDFNYSIACLLKNPERHKTGNASENPWFQGINPKDGAISSRIPAKDWHRNKCRVLAVALIAA